MKATALNPYDPDSRSPSQEYCDPSFENLNQKGAKSWQSLN